MTMPDYTPDGLRKQFHLLSDMRDARLAKSGPLREARDAMLAEAARKRAEFDAAIRVAENPDGEITLFDLEQSRASICRALKGVTGERPVNAA